MITREQADFIENKHNVWVDPASETYNPNGDNEYGWLVIPKKWITELKGGEKMAQFYANIQGNRGKVTRTGTVSSGIEGHIRGWNLGVQVIGRNEDGADIFNVYLTSGSNGTKTGKHIGSFTEKDLA